MYCLNCGKQMNDSAIFCTNCGYKNDDRINQNNFSSSNNRGLNLLRLPFVPVLCIVAIVVLCIIGYKIFSNRTCQYCDKMVFKEGLCRDHYSEKTQNDAIADIISGKKNAIDAVKDVYEKTYTDEEKKYMEDSIDRLKRSLNGTITEDDKKYAEDMVNSYKKSIGDLFK